MQYIAGLSGCDFNISANYDGASPPLVHAGQSLSVTLDNGNGTQGFTCTTAILATVEYDLSVPGLVTYKLAGKSSGTYTIATT